MQRYRHAFHPERSSAKRLALCWAEAHVQVGGKTIQGWSASVALVSEMTHNEEKQPEQPNSSFEKQCSVSKLVSQQQLVHYKVVLNGVELAKI
jgi:hypothetical protein